LLLIYICFWGSFRCIHGAFYLCKIIPGSVVLGTLLMHLVEWLINFCACAWTKLFFLLIYSSARVYLDDVFFIYFGRSSGHLCLHHAYKIYLIFNVFLTRYLMIFPIWVLCIELNAVINLWFQSFFKCFYWSFSSGFYG